MRCIRRPRYVLPVTVILAVFMVWKYSAVIRHGDFGLPVYHANADHPPCMLSSEPKPILVQYYNIPEWVSLDEFKGCEYKCEMISGSKTYNSVKVVMFHGPRIEKQQRPPTKLRGQIWIMHGMEPPAYYWNDLSQWKNLFNWTFTYRRDSDIMKTHFGFQFVPNNTTVSDIIKERKTKDRISAWTVSHCGAVSKRDQYAKLLRKFTDIHVYGNCGPFKCPRSKEEECSKRLQKHYRYYLAFENSLCVDYNSYRPFKTYRHSPSTISVMRGGSNYSLFFPPGSYLDTKDFDTTEKLGNLMNRSDAENRNLERSFTWVKRYSVDEKSMDKAWCSLCERIHHSENYKRLYANIHDWLYDKPRSACKDAKDLL